MKYASTKGGYLAHIMRRVFHVSILSIPFGYYFLLVPFFPHDVLRIAIILFLCAVILFEVIRIRLRLVFFAQRLHEATHFSAFAWTMVSIGFILLFAPSMSYAVAIVGSCALSDPILGELRKRQIEKKKIIVTGWLVVLLVWTITAYFFHLSYLWGFLMAPITIAVEWPSFKWIDDNALMLLVPLVLIIFSKGILHV